CCVIAISSGLPSVLLRVLCGTWCWFSDLRSFVLILATLFAFLLSSVFQGFDLSDQRHQCLSVVRFLRVSRVLSTLFSSITSSGHSSQLCSQHTIKSQPFGSCPCLTKFLLSCSSSILTRCSLS